MNVGACSLRALLFWNTLKQYTYKTASKICLRALLFWNTLKPYIT